MAIKIRLKANVIKQLLVNLCKNQTGLALHVGIQPSNMSTLMRGRPCSMATVVKLADALCVDPEEIIEKFDEGGGRGFGPVRQVPQRHTGPGISSTGEVDEDAMEAFMQSQEDKRQLEILQANNKS